LTGFDGLPDKSVCVTDQLNTPSDEVVTLNSNTLATQTADWVLVPEIFTVARYSQFPAIFKVLPPVRIGDTAGLVSNTFAGAVMSVTDTSDDITGALYPPDDLPVFGDCDGEVPEVVVALLSLPPFLLEPQLTIVPSNAHKATAFTLYEKILDGFGVLRFICPHSLSYDEYVHPGLALSSSGLSPENEGKFRSH
jgi:hypothetical protein